MDSGQSGFLDGLMRCHCFFYWFTKVLKVAENAVIGQIHRQIPVMLLTKSSATRNAQVKSALKPALKPAATIPH